jgi:hypothetical protein
MKSIFFPNRDTEKNIYLQKNALGQTEEAGQRDGNIHLNASRANVKQRVGTA